LFCPSVAAREQARHDVIPAVDTGGTGVGSGSKIGEGTGAGTGVGSGSKIGEGAGAGTGVGSGSGIGEGATLPPDSMKEHEAITTNAAVMEVIDAVFRIFIATSRQN